MLAVLLLPLPPSPGGPELAVTLCVVKLRKEMHFVGSEKGWKDFVTICPRRMCRVIAAEDCMMVYFRRRP
jgi:hypothetical protein